MPPTITAGITCYNAEGTIERAIRSVRDQDYPNLEILIVDDCSQDATVATAERAAEVDDRVRVIRHDQNTGPGGARRTLLENSSGEYMAFFDDDDESAPDRITVQHRRLREHENAASTSTIACYASGTRFYDNGYTVDISAIGSEPLVPVGHQVIDYLLFNKRAPRVFYGGGTPACALMAATDTMRAVGGFDPQFRRVEDADFAIRLGLAGGHFVGTTERLYTQYATHAVDKSAGKNFEAEMQLMEKYRGYLESQNRYGFARRWATVRYHHFNKEHGQMVMAMIACGVRNPVLVLRQLLTTVPARMRHERRMNR